MDSTDSQNVRAPAKINLGLEVLRRRDDGYHDINTVFATLDFGDDLLLRWRHDGRVVCGVEGDDGLEADERNLAVRAAMLLGRLVGTDAPGVEIVLRKRIPVGAGLGGGSSDAAAVLRALPRLWQVDVPANSLHSIALELGSDVPFFLHGGFARATSRGERLEPLHLRLPWTVLLVNPGIHVPTGWAYSTLGIRPDRVASDFVAALRQGLVEPATLSGALSNDFERSIFAAHPRLAALKREIASLGALFTSMSGSGATMYGLFDTPDAAAHAASSLGDERWVRVCRFTSIPPPDAAAESV